MHLFHTNYRNWSLLLLGILFFPFSGQSQGVDSWRIGNPYVSRTDAAFSYSPEYGALISGRSLLFQPMMPGQEAITNTLPGNIFPAMYNSKPVSAAISVDPSTVLLFKGDVYIPVDKGSLQPTGNASTWTGWPAYWKNDIDAALMWNDGSYIFIRGLQYISYDPNTGQMSRPSQMNRWPGWPSNWTMGIDAAFNGQDGFYYFIRKGQILAMDAATQRFAPGYPRPLSGGPSGVTMVGSNNLQTQQNFPTQNNQPGLQRTAPVAEGEDWCAVGTPDSRTAPDGGNIAPVITQYAGSEAGADFKDFLPAGTHVSEIRMWGTWMISGIEVITQSRDGFVSENGVHGEKQGSPNVFRLSQGECILGMEGTYGGNSGDYIYTLRFVTNKRKSQEFGGLGGRKGEHTFNFKIPPEGSFSGFAGRADRYLTAIGLQYYIYQYVAFGADGKLIEATGDKSAWNSGTGDPNKVVDNGPEDPYFDNHSDAQTDGTVDNRFTYTIMPNYEWVGQNVDYVRLDPWDVASGEDLPPKPVLDIIISERIGGPESKWLIPHGSKSRGISSGVEAGEIKISNSFSKYTNEFDLKVGAKFEVKGVASGTMNARHKTRKTQSIGTEKILISKTINRKSFKLDFDLDWVDRDGTKKRQRLAYEFREAIENLPAPKGAVREVPSSEITKSRDLPANIKAVQPQYMELIRTYGTHYLNNIVFGGYYKMITTMNKTEAMSGKMTYNQLAASFEGKIKGVGGGASVDVSNMDENENSSSTSETKIDIIASGGGGNTIFDQWSDAASREPRPQDFVLYYISDLLSPVFFPFDDDIEKKQIALNAIIRKYIVDHSIPVPNPNHEIPLTFKEQKAAEENDPNRQVTIKIEIPRWKINIEEGDGEGDTHELTGDFVFQVIDKSEKQIKYGEPWKQRSNEEFAPKKYKTLNYSTTFQVKSGDIPDLKMQFWGWVKDDDTWSGDDMIWDLDGPFDGPSLSFDALSRPGDQIYEPVHIGGSEAEGAMTAMVRITWVE